MGYLVLLHKSEDRKPFRKNAPVNAKIYVLLKEILIKYTTHDNRFSNLECVQI